MQTVERRALLHSVSFISLHLSAVSSLLLLSAPCAGHYVVSVSGHWTHNPPHLMTAAEGPEREKQTAAARAVRQEVRTLQKKSPSSFQHRSFLTPQFARLLSSMHTYLCINAPTKPSKLF